jgi:hypothetical protein
MYTYHVQLMITSISWDTNMTLEKVEKIGIVSHDLGDAVGGHPVGLLTFGSSASKEERAFIL